MEIKFKYWNCFIDFGYYSNGQTALKLLNIDDGSLIAVSTVAIDDYVGTGEVAIKDYSENEGMLDCLIEYGIISSPKRYSNSGFVTIPVCDLLISTTN